MNRPSAAWLVTLLGAALSWTASAQEPGKKGAPTPAPAESLDLWAWREALQLPEAAPGALLALTVPPEVFDKALPDLSDLRLADADGKQIPYALRIRRAELQQVPVAVQTPFNRTSNAAGRYAELSLALKGDGPVQHNEVEVATAGTNFRRAVQVYGADSDQLDKAEKIADRYVVRYEIEGKTIELRKLSYELSHYRYLKVRVHADPSGKEEAPTIERVTARRTTAVPGVSQTWAANLGAREAVPADGGPGSAWLLELPGRETVPWEQLQFDVQEDEFARPYRLEVADPDAPRRVVARGDWRRGLGGRRPPDAEGAPGDQPGAGDGRRPLVIDLPGAVSARRLRLVLTDFANPPLTLTGARSVVAARQVLFALPRDGAVARPVWLYFGNARATPPHYDFARTLPAQVGEPARVGLAKQPERNPAYRPPPLPLSERWPWMVYLVLGAAALVLLVILTLLARQAVARHDAVQPPA